MERMTDYKPQERQDLEELYRKQNVRINELEEENKELKKEIEGWKLFRKKFDSCLKDYKELVKDYMKLEEENRKLKEWNNELIENHKKDIAILCEENKKLKETIKDHQLYEEKLEHRIIEFEELLHGE